MTLPMADHLRIELFDSNLLVYYMMIFGMRSCRQSFLHISMHYSLGSSLLLSLHALPKRSSSRSSFLVRPLSPYDLFEVLFKIFL